MRDNFVTALDLLLDGGSYVGIATHDEWLLERGLERVAEMDREEYEFQMLLGVAGVARGQAREGGSPPADLHAVRTAMAGVLHAPAAGESQDRRVHPRRPLGVNGK